MIYLFLPAIHYLYLGFQILSGTKAKLPVP